MRGFFGIGVEGLSKPMNAGNLFRSAHAFGASFLFTVGVQYPRGEAGLADTSDAPGEVPLYEFATTADLDLPSGCRLVGVELTDGATELPSFRHPRQAAYVLGPERGALSAPMLEKCAFTVKIPTKFCINVATAGAIVMYDRLISLGRFASRPVRAGGEPMALAAHVAGGPVIRSRGRRR
ncbi:MAG: RNA methyltransferase [Alphaproteobacteria bacterium]